MNADDRYDPPEQWHVYYCYAPGGDLLYIGCTRYPEDRVRQHGCVTGSRWWKHCQAILFSEAMRRSDAFELERVEIQTHGPAFNVEHNVTFQRPKVYPVPTGPVQVACFGNPWWLEAAPSERAS